MDKRLAVFLQKDVEPHCLFTCTYNKNFLAELMFSPKKIVPVQLLTYLLTRDLDKPKKPVSYYHDHGIMRTLNC